MLWFSTGSLSPIFTLSLLPSIPWTGSAQNPQYEDIAEHVDEQNLCEDTGLN